MAYPASPYIEERDGGLYVAGARMSLDSVVIRFQEGSSPDRIVHSFPTLKLPQGYGAISHYLENEEKIDEYVAEGEGGIERSEPPLTHTNPDLFARLEVDRPRMDPNRA